MSTYNLSKPMTYEQFNLMPRDLQREYLLKLRNDMHASARAIALMFGCSGETVRCAIHELGIGTGGKKMVMSRDQLTRWNNWLLGDAANTPVSVTEPETEAETILAAGETQPVSEPAECVELTEAPHYASLTSGKLNLRGTASEILSRLAVVLEAESDARMFVSVKFSVGNEVEA